MGLSLQPKGLSAFFFWLKIGKLSERGREEISPTSSLTKINNSSFFVCSLESEQLIACLVCEKGSEKQIYNVRCAGSSFGGLSVCPCLGLADL